MSAIAEPTLTLGFGELTANTTHYWILRKRDDTRGVSYCVGIRQLFM